MSKYNDSNDILIKCPYYHHQKSCTIVCDGMVDASLSTVSIFQNKQAMKEQLSNFCKTFCYSGCPVAIAIESRGE